MLKKLILNSYIILVVILPSMVFAQSDSVVMPLWPNGAPGFEKRRNEPEKGDKYISNVHNPTITIFSPPKGKSNGAAVVILPGGGHRILVIHSEGYDPARYLTTLGITAIVVKYRLARDTNSPYKIEVNGKEDGYRAMRLVRSNAAKWGIDSNRIGLMAFSAGGEIANLIAFQSGKGNVQAADPVDRLNGKPNFLMMIYPGPLGVPEIIPPDAPPAFMLAADDDPCCAVPVVSLLQKYREAKVPIEVHIYAKGGHGFHMAQDSKLQSLKSWRRSLFYWLTDNDFLNPVSSK
ncbi:MAG: alpha/beta hydrolase [Mucilaginibacter sp.]|nr:alpha/beta hydrolase [Mucilaginibacter sp.]